MNYNKIRKMDISNGPGVRVSVFFQGCAFHCKNCFNKETWDFEAGNSFGDEQIEEIIKLAEPGHISGLSILGGEPMHPKNIENTTKLVKRFKKSYPNKTIWAWSGFLFDDYLKDKEVVNYLDVLVDGQFVDELRDPRLKWRGSANQRVINVPESLKKKEIILYCD
ncbi:MAG: anaerobic ribonucleoside-triphosphate reductase activating protein [Bacilli bacterium]|nr:anaerobic ribonucleoside-triphosphate reductase activating protein [Bacilli bacterium]